MAATVRSADPRPGDGVSDECDLGRRPLVCDDLVAEFAIGRNLRPVLRLEGHVVTAETAAGHAAVPEMVGISTPRDVHMGKDVGHVDLLQGRDRLVDRM
jgi:hypothetical protein